MIQFLKQCPKCRKRKWNFEFYVDKRSNKLNSWCKECTNERTQKRYQDNPQQKRKHHLKSKYKLTLENYILMLKSQNGVCKICGQSETTKYKNRIKQLCVDHKHLTGKIRGLLCDNCNRMLGYAKDNIETLKQAIKYLEETK